MKSDNDLLEIGKDKLKQWKTIVDEIEVQMALGKAELKEAYQEEKKNFGRFFSQQKAQFEKDKNSEGEVLGDLVKVFENFESLLSKTESRAAVSQANEKKELLQKINETEFAIHENYDGLKMTLQRQLDWIKSALDSFRLRVALEKFTSDKEFEDARMELQASMEKFCTRVMGEKRTEERFDKFVDELSSSFSHLKKAVSEVLA